MIAGMQWVLRYLPGVVDPVPVVHKVPEDRPEVFVRVDQAPPHRIDLVVDATLIILQVYAPTTGEAFALAGRLRDAMDEASWHCDGVLGWDEESGPHIFPDPELRSTARVQLTGRLYSDNR